MTIRCVICGAAHETPNPKRCKTCASPYCRRKYLSTRITPASRDAMTIKPQRKRWSVLHA